MDRSTKVCEIVEALHEEITPDTERLTDFQVGAVMRAAAEFVVDEILEERAALLAYIEHYMIGDARAKLILSACQDGVHRRRASRSMEAVCER